MSKLNELIQELCPDGVEYRKLGDLGVFYGGITGKSKGDFVDGNAKLVTYMNVYSNMAVNQNMKDTVKIGDNENQRALQYGDVCFTGSSETLDECGFSSVVTEIPEEPLYLNSFCFFFRFNEPDKYYPGFLKYLFRTHDLRIQIRRTANGVTRFNVSKEAMKKVVIPIPPLPVQREIVRILDTFTKLTAELTAELDARKKQYEYYRDELLSFSGGGTKYSLIKDLMQRYCPDGVEYKPLEQCCNILDNKRKPVTKDSREAGEYPYYGANGIQDYVSDYIFDGIFVLVGEDGSVITPNGNPVVTWAEGKIWVNNHAHIVSEVDGVFLRYLYHFVQTVNISNYVHGNIPKLTGKDFRGIEVSVLPLEVQREIIRILDNFNSICTDISSGLPAEIEARQKQYEYYRDKLLTFKRKETN